MISTDLQPRESTRAIDSLALTLGLLSLTTFALWWLAMPLAITTVALGILVRRRGRNPTLGVAVVMVGCCALVVAIVVAVVFTPATLAAR